MWDHSFGQFVMLCVALNSQLPANQKGRGDNKLQSADKNGTAPSSSSWDAGVRKRDS